MKSRTYIISLIALASIAISACDRIPGAGLGTAVIDLGAIAKATGEDERIQQASQASRERLNAELAEAGANLEVQLTAERERLGEAPTAEQQQQYVQLQQQAQQQYGQFQQQAQQEAQRLETELVMNLREKIKPVAEGIAKSRGVSVVFLSDVTLFWSDPKADITDEVIAELRADPSLLADAPEAAPAAADAPAVDAPAADAPAAVETESAETPQD
jgi:Skp family chaperone for outer membrane proteins